jgi:hypothetical protein
MGCRALPQKWGEKSKKKVWKSMFTATDTGQNLDLP